MEETGCIFSESVKQYCNHCDVAHHRDLFHWSDFFTAHIDLERSPTGSLFNIFQQVQLETSQMLCKVEERRIKLPLDSLNLEQRHAHVQRLIMSPKCKVREAGRKSQQLSSPSVFTMRSTATHPPRPLLPQGPSVFCAGKKSYAVWFQTLKVYSSSKAWS